MARRAQEGFSLVELMVAVAFMAILMAGMAGVFKTSLSTFYTSGEKISNLRRNRAALDLVYDDLNSAGMSMVDITSPLASSTTNPAFYIIPNVPIPLPGPNDPTTTDELYMAYDQPLPFDGSLISGGGAVSGSTAEGKVLSGGSMTLGTDDTYVVECWDPAYAQAVKAGMNFHIKDDMSHAAYQILVPTVVNSTQVSVTVQAAPTIATQVTGRGDPGVLRPVQRIVGSAVVFINPSQMVRYHIVMLNMDPSNANGIPCLVREQGLYTPAAGFTPDPTLTQVIAENTSAFKVFLSADSGKTWAGSDLASGVTGFASGWSNGIQAELNTQLGTVARTNYTTTAGDLAWYRDIPVLVRMDISTRTATQRAEYSTTGNALAYKQVTQSVVLVPRHFGLPLS